MERKTEKRHASFRKIFPRFFFSNKYKNKDTKEPNHSYLPKASSNNKNPLGGENTKQQRINGNIDIRYIDEQEIDGLYTEFPADQASTNKTLVLESAKRQANSTSSSSLYGTNPTARPRVPPKPLNDATPTHLRHNQSLIPQYPDVYYHSLENFKENANLKGELNYRKSQDQTNPASVGAEIKKVSTKFLISPKKEAEVRTLLPTRARSLSFNHRSANMNRDVSFKNKLNINKPYNYSAPTSPIPVNHKIPNMPKTISPYEHVRKTIMETEEKRNSLNRCSRNKSTPSPQIDDKSSNQPDSRISSPTSSILKGYRLNDIEKEKTRQKVEAFYWHKLKELKQKEEEYLLKQSMGHQVASKSRCNTFNPQSSCSTPSSFGSEHKSFSLPRDRSVVRRVIRDPEHPISPFSRGAPERKTDTFVNNIFGKTNKSDQDIIVYRHPEKLFSRNASFGLTTNNHVIPTKEKQKSSLYAKRVSFEEQYSTKNCKDTIDELIRDEKMLHKAKKYPEPVNWQDRLGSKGLQRVPPQPPLRTTSVSYNKSFAIVSQKSGINSCGSRSIYSESESGSEAGEIQRILQINSLKDDWHTDGRNDGGQSDGEVGRGPRESRVRPSRRDDPRRHTLAGNQHLYVHPHHQGPSASNMEALRYPPPNNNLLFDDDPGIMSEVETASTGFHRGGKQRSSLPVVRTPSKTLERPLGLVFLQYRSETKRALLPNEITSIDTVKALFVRSFPLQLTMQYLDSPLVKIYIHDSSKDMFYELEDERAHLRDIRDRTVLRLFEATDMGGGGFPGSVGVGSVPMPPSAGPSGSGPASWDADQNYFSEPEIDNDYHSHHVHKSKAKAPAYYMGTSGPTPSTLPRGRSLMRAFSPAAPPVPADRVKSLPGSSAQAADGYMSSPERATRGPYGEDPYYSQYMGTAVGRPAVAPIIDEETGDATLVDDVYQVYPVTAAPRSLMRPSYDSRISQPEEMQRLRVEKMERQLANLTGLVQKALQVPPGAAPAVAPRQEFHTYGIAGQAVQDAARYSSIERPPKLGRDKFQKSVSFEKSVSFSDEPPDMSSPKTHSPQHSADTKPTKPAIKSSTLPRTSSQERDRLKPAPPPKPAGLVAPQMALSSQRNYNINVTPEFFVQLNALQKQGRDLRLETRNLRRSTLSHAIQMRQIMGDTIVKIGALAASVSANDPDAQLTREEEIYRQDMLLLENDLYDLEATVERLRGQAANSCRETRVNMADIERIAMVLSKSSKTVADWKLKFPILQNTMKIKLNAEMEKVVRKEKMLEEEPERLELALRRCKKLTGTLVTLKRLACVQEQRLPIADGRMGDGHISPGSSSSTFTGGPSSEDFTSDSTCQNPQTHNKGTGGNCGGRDSAGRGADLRPENALDALLDELQTFAKPAPAERSGRGEGSLRRLHSYPSGSDTDASPPVRARGQHPPKPPVPERHPELLAIASRRAPPPPPPRTTSRSPLASPTSPTSPPRTDSDSCHNTVTSDCNSSEDKTRQALLEQRHQELLKKQRALQEQYARLQMIQRSGPALPMNAQPDLKKTGSESNLLTKMNLNLAPAAMSGSMTHLAGATATATACNTNGNTLPADSAAPPEPMPDDSISASKLETTTNKIYETDIL